MAPKRSLPQASTSAPKRKKQSPSARDADKVALLEKELTEALQSSASLNPLVDLLALSDSDDAAAVHKTVYALYRVFVLAIDTGLLGEKKKGQEGAEEAGVVRRWVRDRWDDYMRRLVALLHHDEAGIRTAALEILMALLKPLSSALSTRSGQPRMDALHMQKVVHALLLGSVPASSLEAKEETEKRIQEAKMTPKDVLELFLEKWLSVHDDVRWFFLREAAALLIHPPSASTSTTAGENLLSLLERLTTMPTSPKELNTFWVSELSVKPKSSAPTSSAPTDDADPSDWLSYFDEPPEVDDSHPKAARRTSQLSVLQSLHHLPSHRAVFSDCWLALLPHLRTPALAARALQVLHKLVLPHFTRPLRLMDWVAGCVDHGGVIGLLALNALFTLMKDHNLDYPLFYPRLYSFLTRDVLHLKYRARFFRLTELFLSSTHLPVALLASFVKRLARLSLSAPPAAIVMILPLTYNILKQHPSLMPLIHRDAPSTLAAHPYLSTPGGTTADQLASDPFDPTEPDPLQTKAIDSSLWELNTHREHYLPSVATMARILSEPFTKPSYALEDFLDHTYGTMFEAEVKRRIKREPALAGEYEGLVFPPSSMPRGAEKEDGTRVGDVVAELWGFGLEVGA